MFTHRSVQKESSLALLRPDGEQISGAVPGGGEYGRLPPPFWLPFLLLFF